MYAARTAGRPADFAPDRLLSPVQTRKALGALSLVTAAVAAAFMAADLGQAVTYVHLIAFAAALFSTWCWLFATNWNAYRAMDACVVGATAIAFLFAVETQARGETLNIIVPFAGAILAAAFSPGALVAVLTVAGFAIGLGVPVAGPGIGPPFSQAWFAMFAFGAFLIVIAYGRDRAVQRRDEALRRTARTEFEAREKSDRSEFLKRFLDRASHELRTPLTPAMLDTYTLRPDQRPDEQTIQRLQRSVSTMHHVVISMMLHGRALNRDGLGPPPNLDLLPMLVDLLGKGPWTQHVTIEEDRPGRVAMHPEHLVPLIEQLADNAQRFAPEAQHEIILGPGPELRWFQEPPLLSREKAATLGEPFMAYHPDSRGGIGLYILKDRLAKLGGHYECRLDQGRLISHLKFPGSPGDDAETVSENATGGDLGEAWHRLLREPVRRQRARDGEPDRNAAPSVTPIEPVQHHNR